jgi:putative ABC transport system substrate-binding protein
MGFVEGRDVVLERRSAKGDYRKAPELLADLIEHKVEVIVVSNTAEAQAAKRATSSIPIVMASVGDPVGSGLVASLARPGGNITGLSTMIADISAKRLQLLKELNPEWARVAVLWNPDTRSHRIVLEELKQVAPSLSMNLDFVAASTPVQLPAALSALIRAHTQILYVVDDGFFFAQRALILKTASKAHLPVVYGQREFAYEGALMFYGPDLVDMYRHSAQYVARILNGAKAGDLPVEQPTKFELIVNLKTARALGLTIPEALLTRADEVIQ